MASIDKRLRQCSQKKRYKTRKSARMAAAYLTKATGIEFSEYECDLCYFYHLTSGGFVGSKAIRQGYG